MDWNEIKVQWPSQRALIARRWQRLSERELDDIAGDRARLCARIGDVYCIDTAAAHRQVAEWEEANDRWDPSSAEGPSPTSPESVARGSSGKASGPDIEHLVSTGTFPAQPEGVREQGHAPAPCDERGYMDDEAQRDKNEPADSGAGT